MGFKTTALLVLAALSAANAFYKLVPENKELIYEYKALVKAGTQYPEDYASEFYLHGKLHVQMVGKVAYMKFTDLVYKMYNGPVEHELTTHEIPVPTEVTDHLYKVWKVVYDEEGKVTGYSTYPEEEAYTQNIKKSIASIFQMNYNKVFSTQKKHAFITTEPSIYGEDETHYNVIPHEDGTWNVERVHEMENAHHLYQHVMKNVELHECEAERENPISHDSQKEYTITKVNDHFVAKHISATGGLYLHPFKAESEAQYVYSNVTFELMDMTPIQTKLQMTSEHYVEGLEHMPFDDTVETTDLYQGRRTHNMQNLEAKIMVILKEIVEYMEKHHIHTEKPDIAHGQSINRIHHLMIVADMPTIKHIWTVLSEKTTPQEKKMFEVYQQLLPMVATRHTLMYIMELISTNKVKDTMALKMLHSMPMNVKIPTMKLMTDLEPLMHMDETHVSWEVRKAAILSYATLLHKSHQYLSKKYNLHHEDTNTQPQVLQMEQFFNKYVMVFINKLKEAKTYDTKMTYLGALFNMGVPAIVPHMEKIVKGEWLQDEHMHLMSMWAIFPTIAHDSNKVYELYWPIFTDLSEDTHSRILAYYLMMEARPSLSRMINMYWHMQHETNHQVYQFYYKYLETLAKTEDPCRYKTQLHAKQLLKYAHPPNYYGLTGYYELEYFDQTYGMGKGLSTYYVLDNNTAFFKMSWASNFFNVPMYPATYVIKVHGIEGLDKMGLNTKEPITTLFNVQEVAKYFTDIKKVKDLHVEVVMYIHNQITHSYYFDLSNLEDLPMIFGAFSEDFDVKNNYISMVSTMYSKMLIPTEIGFTALAEWMVPSMHHGSYNFKKETIKGVTTFHIDNDWKTWTHGSYGLAFYNSITDVWQGVKKVRSYDSTFPVYMDITFTSNPGSVKFAFKKHKDDVLDTWGYRSHVTSMTYVKDDFKYGVLAKSTPKAVQWAKVTKGEEYKHDYPITHTPLPTIGYDHIVTIYDSERQYTNRTLKSMGHIFDLENDIFDSETESFLMAWIKKWDHTLLQPYPMTNGIMEKFMPSKEYPVTTYDVSIRAHYDITKGDQLLYPGMKLNTRWSFNSHQEEKTLKTWDIHAIFDMNPGHTVQNMKMQFYRIIPGQTPFKTCVEGTKKWTSESVIGHMSFAVSTGPVEKKCTEEDKVLEIKMKGEKSEEQLSKYPVYGHCDENVLTMDGHHHKLLPCYMAQDTFRKYTYDIENKKLGSMEKLYATYFWDVIKGYFYENYDFVEEPSEEIKPNHIKAIVTYPLEGHTFNTYIVTPNHEYHLQDMEDWWSQYLYFHPETVHYSGMYKFMHRMGLTHYCALYNDTIHYKYNTIPYQMPTTWTMIVGDAMQNPPYAVYAKEIEGTHNMALKFQHKTHTLVIEPTTEGHYEITYDGTKLTPEQHTGEWFYYQQIPHSDFMGIITMHLGVHLYYDGTHVHVDVPKMDVPYYGLCYKH